MTNTWDNKNRSYIEYSQEKVVGLEKGVHSLLKREIKIAKAYPNGRPKPSATNIKSYNPMLSIWCTLWQDRGSHRLRNHHLCGFAGGSLLELSFEPALHNACSLIWWTLHFPGISNILRSLLQVQPHFRSSIHHPVNICLYILWFCQVFHWNLHINLHDPITLASDTFPAKPESRRQHQSLQVEQTIPKVTGQ